MVRMTDPVAHLQFSAEDLAIWKSDGYIKLRGLLSAEHVQAMRDDIDHILDIVEPGGPDLKYGRQYLNGSAVDKYVHSLNLCSIAGQLLQTPCSLLSNGLLVKRGFGKEIPFHQDDYYTETKNGGFLNIWIALSDSGTENGGLTVCPKSHRAGRLRSRKSRGRGSHFPNITVANRPETCIVMDCAAGDALAFTNFTVHGSAANRTPHHRYSYSTVFFKHGTVIRTRDSDWSDPLVQSDIVSKPVDQIDPMIP